MFRLPTQSICRHVIDPSIVFSEDNAVVREELRFNDTRIISWRKWNNAAIYDEEKVL